MSSKLAVHWIPMHVGTGDFVNFQRMQPRSIKEVNPNPERSKAALQRVPGALYVLRDHPLSEQHAEKDADPEGTGIAHADKWAKELFPRWRDWNQNVPLDQIRVCLLNEPKVWGEGPKPAGGSELKRWRAEQDAAIDRIVRYTVAALDRLKAHGLRGLALNLSVGWPDNDYKDGPPHWYKFEPVREAILRGGHSLGLHEYFGNRGPQHLWRWHCGRYTQCPWDVEIVIGEFGLDQYVLDGSVARHERGWKRWTTPQQYMEWLKWYDQQILRDRRIHSAQLFTWDYGSNEWASFDVREGEMVRLLVEYAEWMRTQPEPPNEWHPPAPPAPPGGTPVVIDRPSKYYSSRQGRKVEWIVIHSAEAPVGSTPEGTLAWLTDHPANVNRVSSHELVAEDGRVWRLVPDHLASHHGEGIGAQLPGIPHEWINESSWGIEAHNIAYQPLGPRTVELLIWRATEACKRFGLPSSRVIGHREYQPGKHDPTGVDMGWFRGMVAMQLGEKSTDPYAIVGPGVKAAMQARGDTPVGPERYIGDWMSVAFGKSGRMYVYSKDANRVMVYRPE